MKRYLSKVRHCIKSFKSAKFQQIPREENMKADSLAKTASTDGIINEQVRIQYIPSIDVPEVQQIDGEANQTTPIISYLKDGVFLKEKEEEWKLRVRVAKFVLMDKVLFKRGFSQPYLRCLTPDKSNYVMKDIHEEACGNHSRARSLIHKIVCAGQYQSFMQVDAKAQVRACDQCQCFSNMPR